MKAPVRGRDRVLGTHRLVGADTVTAQGHSTCQDTRGVGTTTWPPAGTEPGHNRGHFHGHGHVRTRACGSSGGHPVSSAVKGAVAVIALTRRLFLIRRNCLIRRLLRRRPRSDSRPVRSAARRVRLVAEGMAGAEFVAQRGPRACQTPGPDGGRSRPDLRQQLIWGRYLGVAPSTSPSCCCSSTAGRTREPQPHPGGGRRDHLARQSDPAGRQDQSGHRVFAAIRGQSAGGSWCPGHTGRSLCFASRCRCPSGLGSRSVRTLRR